MREVAIVLIVLVVASGVTSYVRGFVGAWMEDRRSRDR